MISGLLKLQSGVKQAMNKELRIRKLISYLNNSVE